MLFVQVKNMQGDQVMINLMNVSKIEITQSVSFDTVESIATVVEGREVLTTFRLSENPQIWDLILEAREKLITDLSRTLVRFLARDYPRDHGGRL